MTDAKASPLESSIPKFTRLALLFGVIAIGIILSVVSYTYFVSISKKIDETVTDDLRRQARIEAFQTGQLLEKEIQVVADNAFSASVAPAVINGELERGGDVINSRQLGTADTTDRYFWLDNNGKTVWSSAFAGKPAEYEKFKGFDVSDRPYFVNPSSTKQPYFSPVIQSPIDKSQRMFIAYPILDNGNFKGVVAASLTVDNLGKLIQSKLSPEIETSLGIIDPNGIIIYTSELSLIGEDLFGEKVQTLLGPAFSSQEQLTEFNNFLRSSLQGGSDSQDFTAKTGETSTVNYLPILVKSRNFANDAYSDSGNTDGGYHFLTLYLSAPHNVANIVSPLVDQERNFSVAVIATIATVTAVISYIIITWNNKLEGTVRERTASLRQANERLKIHDKMQTEFINIAAHELRTPVQPLLSIAEQFENDLGKDLSEIKVSRLEIEMLARNAKRLSRLTDDLLEVSRIESNSLRLNKRKVSLVEKITNVINDSKSFVEGGRSLEIQFVPPPNKDHFVVDADESKLFEVLSNLIRNAIKFTKEGVITVKLEQFDGYAQISVRDTGTGIDAEILPKLFEKFVTKAETGNGLGLYISKNLVEAHGGRIWAANNPEGVGATFSFTLPMAQTQKLEVSTT